MSQPSPRVNLSEQDTISPGVIVNTMEAFKSDNVPFTGTVFTVVSGEQTPMDQHDVKECWIILQGTGELTHQDRLYSVKPKDIFFFESQETHQIKNTGKSTLEICSIYW